MTREMSCLIQLDYTHELPRGVCFSALLGGDESRNAGLRNMTVALDWLRRTGGGYDSGCRNSCGVASINGQ